MKNLKKPQAFILLSLLSLSIFSCSEQNDFVDLDEVGPAIDYFYHGNQIEDEEASELLKGNSHALRDPVNRNKLYIFDDRVIMMEFIEINFNSEGFSNTKVQNNVNPDFGYLNLYRNTNFNGYMFNCASSGNIFTLNASQNRYGTPVDVFRSYNANDELSSYKISNYYSNGVLVTFWRDGNYSGGDNDYGSFNEYVGSNGYVEDNSLIGTHYNDEISSISWIISEM